MVDSEMLKARMRYLGLRQKDVAAALGIKQPTMNQKLNNVRPITLSEAEKIQKILKIGDEHFADYFFSDRQDTC